MGLMVVNDTAGGSISAGNMTILKMKGASGERFLQQLIIIEASFHRLKRMLLPIIIHDRFEPELY